MFRNIISKRLFSFILTATITLTGNLGVVSAEVYRGVFQKEQSIINYGIELMDMADSKAFDIYMSLLSIDASTSEVVIDFETPVILEGETQEEVLALNQEKIKSVSNDAQIAVDAFMRDYPEIFWIDYGKSSSNAILSKDANTNYKWCIKGIRVNLTKLDTITEDISSAYDKVLEKLNSVVSAAEGLSNYDKLKYFHNYLCDNISYNLEAANAYSMYGALLEGNSVCEGYAESFKALCDLSGIPCVLLTGSSVKPNGASENHMWNYVLMEDDKWYAVDVTWDDLTNVAHTYFLVGSDTVVSSEGTTFSQSHIADGDFSFTDIHEFTYPELSKNAYVYDSIKNPDDSSEYKLGDVNADTSVNSMDALEILKISAKIRDAGERELLAGDVDGNSKLDATDALNVLKYAAKIIDKFPIEM